MRLRQHLQCGTLLCLASLLPSTSHLRAQEAQRIDVRFENLPPELAKRFTPESFAEMIARINRETARREMDGEFDHLIAYALQSNQFTNARAIEPALSAKVFVESGAVPFDARQRLLRFLRAVDHPSNNARLIYFARLLSPQNRNLAFLEDQYSRFMHFLYAKEFLKQGHLYESRGHSTDTQIQANYAVWNALAVLKATAPWLKIRRVLIVGPGLDFAPRTGLVDAVPPQSFQPYAVADGLIGLHLSDVADLRIDCADINDRVIEFINSFGDGDRLLRFYSEPGTEQFNEYFNSLGNAIGSPVEDATVSSLPASVLRRTLKIGVPVARAIHATQLNIVTQRLTSNYDLVIATNVLLYFNPTESTLALTNIGEMLARNGYFIHNDLRPEIDAGAALLGLEALHARTVLVANGRRGPLYDGFALYRKR